MHTQKQELFTFGHYQHKTHKQVPLIKSVFKLYQIAFYWSTPPVLKMPGIAKESVVLEDGAQTIPTELICGQCQNVLLQPVANTCPHIFCFGCVRKKLASGPAARKCPICDAEWDSEPRELPEQIKAQLNSLKYHCPLKCGGHLYAKEKETHVKKYCANTILLCPNSSKGCRFKIERKNVEEHLQNCHYREVSCEACGHRCLFVNLFSHQLLKRCARDLLQKQYVQSLRKNHKALVDYSKEMKIDRIQTAQVNRNAEVRYKGLTPLRYRRLYSSYGTPSPRHGSIYNDLMSRPTSAYSLSRASRNDDYMRSCRRCTLDFKPSKNHDKACRYHREPFLDLFEVSGLKN